MCWKVLPKTCCIVIGRNQTSDLICARSQDVRRMKTFETFAKSTYAWISRLQNPHMFEFLEFLNLDLCKKLFCWTFNLFNFIHLEFVVSQINTSLYIAISFKYLPSSVLCKIVIPWVLHGLVFWGKFIKFCWRWKLLFENVQHHFMQIDSFGVYLNKS